jgi:hypothetical protein
MWLGTKRLERLAKSSSFPRFYVSSQKFYMYRQCTNIVYKQGKKHINITKTSDTSITIIYHVMSLTLLYLGENNIYISRLSKRYQ